MEVPTFKCIYLSFADLRDIYSKKREKKTQISVASKYDKALMLNIGWALIHKHQENFVWLPFIGLF